MAWVATSDTVYDDPRFLRAGPVASWLHVCAVAWCGRHLTDGWLPEAMLARLGGTPELAAVLVREGLWVPWGPWAPVSGAESAADSSAESRAESSKGWRLDWSGQQPSAKVRARRAEDAKRKALYRNRALSGVSSADSAAESRAESARPSETPLLSSPTISSLPPPVVPPPKAKRQRRPPSPTLATLETWAPSEAHRAKASEAGVPCDLEAEKFKDYIVAKGVRYTDLDAAFRNWLRNAATYQARQTGGRRPQPVAPESPRIAFVPEGDLPGALSALGLPGPDYAKGDRQ